MCVKTKQPPSFAIAVVVCRYLADVVSLCRDVVFRNETAAFSFELPLSVSRISLLLFRCTVLLAVFPNETPFPLSFVFLVAVAPCCMSKFISCVAHSLFLFSCPSLADSFPMVLF